MTYYLKQFFTERSVVHYSFVRTDSLNYFNNPIYLSILLIQINSHLQQEPLINL